MRGRLFLSLALLSNLTACAHPGQGIKVESQEVAISVQKACIATVDIPAEPAALPAPPDDIEKALALSLAKVSEWMRYGEKADVVMHGCAK